jgi:periplasmic protein TonB
MNMRVVERRPMGALGRMGVVAGLHVAVVYLVATGLGIVPKLEIPEPIEGSFIEEQEPIDEAPPVPVPHIPDRVPVPMPEPEAPPLDRSEANDAILAEVIPDPVPMPPSEQPLQPRLVGVQTDARYPLTQPAYPPTDIRQGNEGSVELEVYVLPNGRVGDARVVKSAGSRTLDQSALDEARRKWRLKPATRDGVPQAQWHRLRVVFELKNR